MNHSLTQNTIVKHAALFVFSLLFFLPVSAQNNSSKKEQKVVVIPGLTDPDAYPHKAKPDHHPKPLEQPTLFAVLDEGNQLYGIDVSHYQGRIDWNEAARDTKVGYVYLKATEGVSIVDDTYKQNFNECKRVGLKVGSYLFFRPNYKAKEQYELFRKTVATNQQDLVPLVDAESLKGVSVATFQERLLDLCEMIEKEYGVKPLIYTGQNFYNKYIHGNAKLRAYKYFIAKYDTEPPILSGGDDYVMWQYTARGKVKGVRGFVDQSHFVGRHTLREIIYKK